MKNQEIQGLRGIAAFIVFVSHVIYYAGIVNVLEHTPFGVFFSGSAAVMMFFFLSGYFAFRAPFSIQKTVKGIWNKIKRIYPAYWFGLFFGLAGMLIIGYSEKYDPYFGVTLATSWSQHFTVKDFIIQMLMVVKHTDAGCVDPPVWTMIIEMRMVFLLPFFYLPLYYLPIFKKKSCTASYFLFVVLVCYVLNTIVGISLFHWVPAFVLGGILHHSVNEHWLDGIRKWKNWCIYLGVVVSVCLIALGRNYTIGGVSEDIIFPVSSVGCMILCGMILIKPEAFTFLKRKAVVFMGNISYYFYLTHWTVLAATRGLVVWLVESIGVPFAPAYGIYVIVGFIVALGVATVLYKVLESKRKA
ncbi:MAG: acyltransferase family protein [Lachnospiraceae bacterium]